MLWSWHGASERVPVLEVRFKDALGTSPVLAKVAGKVSLHAMNCADVRLKVALGTSLILAGIAGKVPLLAMDCADVCLKGAPSTSPVLANFAGKLSVLEMDCANMRLKVAFVNRDELAEVTTEHLHVIVDRIDMDLEIMKRERQGI